MPWIKEIIVDLAILAIMALATLGDQVWARWLILVYVPLMLLLKLMAWQNTGTKNKLKPKDTGVPNIVYHLLYGLNVLLAALDQWWLILGGWILIWGLSVMIERK